MTPSRYLAIGIAILLVAGIVVASRLLDDGKRRQLLAAPGLDLVFPYGTLVRESDVGVSILGAGTYKARAYGTDATDEQILAFFDEELKKRGYHEAAPTPDPTRADQGDRLLRQYDQGPFSYRLYVAKLPYPISAGGRITTGYKQILITKLGN